MSYFFERFKWKKLNYGKILNFLPGCYRQRQPYWKKTTNSISAVNHYRIEIFTWFKLHINCIYGFYASSDQIFFILIREKMRLFQKFDTLQRRKFCHQIFNKKFSIKDIEKWLCRSLHYHLELISAKYQSSMIKMLSSLSIKFVKYSHFFSIKMKKIWSEET